MLKTQAANPGRVHFPLFNLSCWLEALIACHMSISCFLLVNISSCAAHLFVQCNDKSANLPCSCALTRHLKQYEPKLLVKRKTFCVFNKNETLQLT